MTTNEERREAAKRKLEQRLEAERQQARKRRLIIGSAVGVVVLAVVATGAFFGYRAWDDSRRVHCTYNEATNQFDMVPDKLTPEMTQGMTPEQKKQTETLLALYKKGKGQQRSKPKPDDHPLKEGTVGFAIKTSVGELPSTLNRADAPCNVNGVISLAQAGYYDGVPCHTMTVAKDFGSLLCGDPTGTALTSAGWAGGNPGWTMPDEAPTNLRKTGEQNPLSPEQQPVVYPAGTIAVLNANTEENPMSAQPATANTGSGTLLIFVEASKLPPNYAVIGTVDDAGKATLKKIKDGGVIAAPWTQVKPGESPSTGTPKTPVIIKGVGVSE